MIRGCVGLDVGTHHQDVAGFQGRVVGEQAQQYFAQHVDLSGLPVAGVHLNGSVSARQATTMGANGIGGEVGLQPAEQGGGTVAITGLVTQALVGGELFRQHHLQLAKIPAEGGEQRVVDLAMAAVVAAHNGTTHA